MKKTVLALLALTLLFVGSVQAQEEYLELLRQDLRTQQTAILTEAMMLDADQGDLFWPVYREYQTELSKLGDARIALIKMYAMNYDNMDDEMADQIVKEAMKLSKDNTALREKYYKKVRKDLGGVVAARFWQVDSLIQDLIDIQIKSELPIVLHTKPAAEPE